VSERLEGRVSVLAALEAGQRSFEKILLKRGFDEEKLSDLLATAKARGVAVQEVEDAELEAHGKSHGGCVALVGAKPLTTAEELYKLVESAKTPAFLALFEGADDVRNLGYVLRTAEAFGCQAAIIRRRAWDVDTTALSRSSSGSYERLPIVLVDRALEEIGQLKRRGLKLVGAIPRARDPIYKVGLTTPLIMAIGGEKRGLSGALRDVCDRLTSIPTVGGPTSLSMTQAAAIALAEVHRQRGAAPAGPAA
jgi:23S rRNA (guanosine2251-2'-O)-methyltransferase